MTTIFLNYRRADSLATAGRLHDSLAVGFGAKNVFMDIDSIPVGVDFVHHLERHVGACDVLLALIGPSWLEARGADGQHRLFDQRDYVATEIAAALARGIPVIPVLIDEAAMPAEDRLPETLKTFASRNAFRLRNEQFRSDVQRLAEKIRETVGAQAELPAKRRLPAIALACLAVFAVALAGWALISWQRAAPSQQRPPVADGKSGAPAVVETPANPPPQVSASPSLAKPAADPLPVTMPKASSYCEAIKSVIASSPTRFESVLGRAFGDNRIARIPLEDWEDCIVFMESRFTDTRRYSCRITGLDTLATAERVAEQLARDAKDSCLGANWSLVRIFNTDRQRSTRLVGKDSDATITFRPAPMRTTPDWLVFLDIE